MAAIREKYLNNRGMTDSTKLVITLIIVAVILIVVPFLMDEMEKTREKVDIYKIRAALEDLEEAAVTGIIDEDSWVTLTEVKLPEKVEVINCYSITMEPNQINAYWQTNNDGKNVTVNGIKVPAVVNGSEVPASWTVSLYEYSENEREFVITAD